MKTLIALLSVFSVLAQAQQINYVYQVAGKPVTDIRQYGAVCDGMTDSNTAVQSALTAGAINVYIPANCVWVAPAGVISSTLAAPISYIGESAVTSIIKSNVSPLTASFAVGPGGTLVNVNAESQNCNLSGVAPVCPVPYYHNQSDSSQTVVSTAYSAFLLQLGITGKDTSGSNIENHGIGDGWYVSTDTLNGTAYRGGILSGNGTVMLAQVNCNISNCTGGSAISVVDSGATSAATNSVIPYAWSSNVKTSGSVFSLTHGYLGGASTFTGDVFNASMAQSSGSFTGSFENFANGGSQVYKVSSQGAEYQPGVAFASLPSAVPGTKIYCTNCTVATPCAGGGSGAWAFAVAGSTWKCPF